MKRTLFMLGLIAVSAVSIVAAPEPLRAEDGGACICAGLGCENLTWYNYCKNGVPQQCSWFCTTHET